MRWVLNSWLVLRSISIGKLLIHARRCQAWCWGNHWIDDKIQFYKIWLIFGETAFLLNLWLTHEIKSNPKSLPSFFLSKLWCLKRHKNWNENCTNFIALHFCCLSKKECSREPPEGLLQLNLTPRIHPTEVRYFETNNWRRVLIFTGNKQIQRWRTQFC